MAAVDALLGIVVTQGADSLLLVEGKAPELSKGGERRPLSMPALGKEMIARFIAEVRAAGDGRYVLESKGGSAAFEVTIEEPGRIEFNLGTPDAAPVALEPLLHEPSSEAPAKVAAVRTHVERLIADAAGREAMDLFFSSSADARMRVGSTLHEIPDSRVEPETLTELLELDEAHRERLDRHGSVDVGLEVGGTRMRANLFRHRGGLAVALRVIRTRIPTLAELGLPTDLGALTDIRDGLVLLVGPTGSGKSTTLAALLQRLNGSRARHVVTIEDPIEYEYESHQCLIHQREVGRDVESFAAGLRAALRESPDVIMVGEMRDRETFAAALTAAETGHLVLSTLHSGSAAMAIDRIIDSFPTHQQPQVRMQLAGVLRAIITQVLVPSVDPGRVVVAVERMMVTHGIAHTIRDSRGHQIANQIQTGRAEGMISLEASLADLVRSGEITLASAQSFARHPDLLSSLLVD